MIKIPKKFKSLFKYFVPYIFFSGNFRELFNSVFSRKLIIHKFEHEKNFYNRHAFINKAISKFENCKYLEIGVSNNDVFNSIPLSMENKFGVDPVSGGNYRMTSDDFFKKYSNLKFDVIFIDGLHEYDQCKKDCINSMKQLNHDGIIFFHDFLPRSFFEEKVPRKQKSWSGDIWKVAIELSKSKNIDFKIINIDMGIGMLKLKKDFEYRSIDGIKNKDFNDFLKYRETLPIINSEEALKII